MDYTSAGVDIEGGDRFARFIASIKSKAVSSGIGGFSGGIEFDPSRYKKPLLMSTTDGAGTKLLVARKLRKFDTIGIDLVAMNVNDLAVCAVQPLSFLDYIALGRLDDKLLHELIRGIVAGCEMAGCVLVGGETAEMPDLYGGGDFDLAGFCVGIGEKDSMLPRLDAMAAGDPLYAIPSSGIHSNGLSLARKAIPETDAESWRELLVPTRIYVRELMLLASTGTIAAAAHITGGGLEGNLSRVLAPGLAPRLSWDWKMPGIFPKIAAAGAIAAPEMRKVFNMGVGIALVVPKNRENEFLAAAADMAVFPIGELARG
ncbi:MAG: phosphoribosylformylglycinamidine cyclo-ligase [Spirochaetales bacterium]|jgi:phosphoribosylformylglycinamidine cyclo-ligase|nr:phosphoribosylformylglycinamidine cyclo-ligase [Spirochaetales bacterium]